MGGGGGGGDSAQAGRHGCTAGWSATACGWADLAVRAPHVSLTWPDVLPLRPGFPSRMLHRSGARCGPALTAPPNKQALSAPWPPPCSTEAELAEEPASPEEQEQEEEEEEEEPKPKRKGGRAKKAAGGRPARKRSAKAAA